MNESRQKLCRKRKDLGFPLFLKKKKKKKIMVALGLHCCKGFSLVAESGDHSLVLVPGLLIVVASLGQHGL